jgi:c(7)-type cytochrome triheme protein
MVVLLVLTVLLTVDGLRNRHAPARAAEPGGQASVTPTYPEKVVFRFQEGSPGPVAFRHASHVKPATSCTECHGAFSPHFEGPSAAEGAADQDFDETLCGKCHVGEDVFAISQDTCGRCHEKGEAAADADDE